MWVAAAAHRMRRVGLNPNSVPMSCIYRARRQLILLFQQSNILHDFSSHDGGWWYLHVDAPSILALTTAHAKRPVSTFCSKLHLHLQRDAKTTTISTLPIPQLIP